MLREILEENLVEGIIETPEEETPKDNSPESADIPDPKEKRHAEQLQGSKAEVERMRGLAIEATFTAAEKDISILQELHTKDPKLAQAVSERFDWEKSEYGTYENFLTWKTVTTITSGELSEEKLEAMLQEREIKKDHAKALIKLEEGIKKLPENIQSEVKTFIDKYSKGVNLDPDMASELLESATLYVNRGNIKNSLREDARASLSSISSPSNAKSSKEEMVSVIKDWKLILVPNTYDI